MLTSGMLDSLTVVGSLILPGGRCHAQHLVSPSRFAILMVAIEGVK